MISTEDGPGVHNAELRIRSDIYEAALAVARRRGMSLASVARLVIFEEQAAILKRQQAADPPAPDPQLLPPKRAYGVKRSIMRFTVPREPFEAAKAAIHSTGRSVSGAVEEGLARFAESEIIPGSAT